MNNEYIKIPEADVLINKNSFLTNYTFYLTRSELETLDHILNNISKNDKPSTFSFLIKKICYNTYLYINNIELDFESNITNITNKNYFKKINPEILKEIKDNPLFVDFIKEIVRSQVLRVVNSSIINKNDLIKKSFRLTKKDENLLRILLGVYDMELYDYIPSLIRFFLQSNNKIQNYILSYQERLIIEAAINNKQYLIYNYNKIKPIKIITNYLSNNNEYLIAIDYKTKNLVLLNLNFSLLKDNISIHQTQEFFKISESENKLIQSYLSNNQLNMSFLI